MYNTIFLIVAKSGAGKTAIVRELEKRYGLKSIPSYTTRKPRKPNEYGHIFVTKDEFSKLDGICGYTEILGEQYGATIAQVDTHDLYVIDVNGVDYFKDRYKGNKDVKVIYIDTSKVNRYLRMINRGDTTEQALERIKIDEIAFSKAKSKANYVVNNDEDIEDTIQNIYEYIKEFEVINE